MCLEGMCLEVMCFEGMCLKGICGIMLANKPVVFRIQISVGNINFIPGYFKYEINFWDNITFRYGLIGAVAGLLILILILVLICCLCCGNRKRKEPRDDVVDLDISSGFDKLEMRPGKTGDNGYITAYSGESCRHCHEET